MVMQTLFSKSSGIGHQSHSVGASAPVPTRCAPLTGYEEAALTKIVSFLRSVSRRRTAARGLLLSLSHEPLPLRNAARGVQVLHFVVLKCRVRLSSEVCRCATLVLQWIQRNMNQIVDLVAVEQSARRTWITADLMTVCVAVVDAAYPVEGAGAEMYSERIPSPLLLVAIQILMHMSDASKHPGDVGHEVLSNVLLCQGCSLRPISRATSVALKHSGERTHNRRTRRPAMVLVAQRIRYSLRTAQDKRVSAQDKMITAALLRILFNAIEGAVLGNEELLRGEASLSRKPVEPLNEGPFASSRLNLLREMAVEELLSIPYLPLGEVASGTKTNARLQLYRSLGESLLQLPLSSPVNPSTNFFAFKNALANLLHGLLEALQFKSRVKDVDASILESCFRWFADFIWVGLGHRAPAMHAAQELVQALANDEALAKHISLLWSSTNILRRVCLCPFSSEFSETGRNPSLFADLRRTRKDKLERGTSIASTNVSKFGPDSYKLALRSIVAQFETPPQWLKMTFFILALSNRGNVMVIHAAAMMGPPLIAAIWRFCLSLIPVLDLLYFADELPRELLASLGGMVSLRGDLQQITHISFSFFAAVVRHLLLVTSDEEIEELHCPLPMNELRQMILLLNKLLFYTVVVPKRPTAFLQMVDPRVPDPLIVLNRDDFLLRANLRTLLRSLVERSLRLHRIVPHDLVSSFWQIDQKTCEKFSVDWANMSTVARRVLVTMPHAVPFLHKVNYLTQSIAADRQEHSAQKIKLGLKVRRSSIIHDALHQLALIDTCEEGATLFRARWHVTFIDQHGTQEAGIDAGGVFKEFIELAVLQSLSLDFGAFTVVEGTNWLFPNPHASKVFDSEEQCMQSYRLIGRIVGKAIYEGVVINVQFAPFFLRNLLERGSSMDDLRLVDPQQYRALQRLKEMADVEEACLFFAVEEDVLGQRVTTDLIPDGRNIPVTNDNVVRYIHLVAHHRLIGQTRPQTQSFAAGLFDVFDRAWSMLFNTAEFQQLISGKLGTRLDVADLKAHTKLVGGIVAGDRTLNLLWEILEEMSAEDQERFLQFCTGSSRPPLLGFQAMHPPFSIRGLDEGSALNYLVDIDRLPTASTCFNLLKLPLYKSKSNMREKLLQAIRSGAGFDLS